MSSSRDNSQNCRCWTPAPRDCPCWRWSRESWAESGKCTQDGPCDTRLAETKEERAERAALGKEQSDVSSSSAETLNLEPKFPSNRATFSKELLPSEGKFTISGPGALLNSVFSPCLESGRNTQPPLGEEKDCLVHERVWKQQCAAELCPAACDVSVKTPRTLTSELQWSRWSSDPQTLSSEDTSFTEDFAATINKLMSPSSHLPWF